jgi:S-DNA-T family DNA segregation ATPase FtsK/SpoIIIE
LSHTSFWRSRIAAEAIGVLLFLAGLLCGLALLSHDPRDPNLFTLTTGAPTAPSNWIGGFGATLSASLYALLGVVAWIVPVFLLFWGFRRFWQRPFENPATKAAGFVFLFLAVPMLLSLALGRRTLFGEEMEGGGIVGRAAAEAVRGRLGTTGAFLLATTLLLLAIPLATQVSLAEVFLGIRVRFAGVLSRLTVGWARSRDRRTKERLRRTVVAKHLEKARQGTAVTLEEVPFAEEGPPVLREIPGPGKFSISRAQPATSSVPRPSLSVAPPAKAAKRKADTQQSLPLVVEGYTYPPTSLMERRESVSAVDRRLLAEIGKEIAAKCAEFGVEGEIAEYHPGPVVTTYEFRPAAGIKVNQVMGLSEDLALALSAESIRIERIPGRASVGIEVPNRQADLIAVRDVLESEKFQRSPSLLTLALGKDIHGEPVVDDLRAMPHLLIAGTTGSGKSVGINSLITSIVYKARPDQVKMILIDPKMVELEMYENLPHLATPIITDPKKAANALKWAVNVMEDRFQTLSELGQVRNAEQYNAAIRDPETVARFREQHPDDPDVKLEPMPLILIIIDELADLMMTAPKEVEEAIVRLAQKARAVGIHLVVATQRPSVDVLTGVIKANLPSRIAYKVSSKIDSRVILDGNGAERLLGRGDMLFLPPGTSRLKRVHGAFVSVQETAALMKFLKKQAKPQFNEEITKDQSEAPQRDDAGDETDPLYDEAARLVVREKMASISFLQRRMGVGFSRAGKLIDMMSRDGLLGPPRGSKPREVLVSEDYFEEVDRQPR